MSLNISFKMFLKPDFQSEYFKRHNNIWPELRALLKKEGISNYNIFLDEKNNELFAFLTTSNINYNINLKTNPLMQKWWNYMSDIMICNDDNSPKTENLKQVFFLE